VGERIGIPVQSTLAAFGYQRFAEAISSSTSAAESRHPRCDPSPYPERIDLGEMVRHRC